MIAYRSRPGRRLPMTGVSLALLVAVSLTAAACGTRSASPGVASVGSRPSTTSPSRRSLSSGGAGGGGGGGAPAGGQKGGATIGITGVSLKFAQCMQTHGVPNFPDPNGQGKVVMHGVDPSSSQFKGAQRACAKYAPNGGKPPSAAQQQAFLAKALKFSKCMRAHGITDFPDPQTRPGGGVSISLKAGPGSDLSPKSPQFQAAQKACRSLLPGGGP